MKEVTIEIVVAGDRWETITSDATGIVKDDAGSTYPSLLDAVTTVVGELDAELDAETPH